MIPIRESYNLFQATTPQLLQPLHWCGSKWRDLTAWKGLGCGGIVGDEAFDRTVYVICYTVPAILLALATVLAVIVGIPGCFTPRFSLEKDHAFAIGAGLRSRARVLKNEQDRRASQYPLNITLASLPGTNRFFKRLDIELINGEGMFNPCGSESNPGLRQVTPHPRLAVATRVKHNVIKQIFYRLSEAFDGYNQVLPYHLAEIMLQSNHFHIEERQRPLRNFIASLDKVEILLSQDNQYMSVRVSG